MMKLFYNTNLTKEPELQLREEKALSQEEIIKNIFKREGKHLTAGDVHYICIAEGMLFPLTSVRRAMSTLKNKGFLVKLKEVKKSKYNVNENYYEYRNEDEN